jgi:diketogulonate reductase-like aldo/keto reductase
MSSPTEAHVRTLSNGQQIPLLALEMWQVPDGSTAENAVLWALELGYRHIDTAQVYGNEGSIGRALAQSGVPRDQVFVTTNFNFSRKHPSAEVERSLQRLGLDYVDLYLIHSHQRGRRGHGPAWSARAGAWIHAIDRGIQFQRERARSAARGRVSTTDDASGSVQSAHVPAGLYWTDHKRAEWLWKRTVR